MTFSSLKDRGHLKWLLRLFFNKFPCAVQPLWECICFTDKLETDTFLGLEFKILIESKTLTDKIQRRLPTTAHSHYTFIFIKKTNKAWFVAKYQVSIQETDKSSSLMIHLTFSISLWLTILLTLDLFWNKSFVALCPFSTDKSFGFDFVPSLLAMQNCNSASRFGTNEILKYQNVSLNRKILFSVLPALAWKAKPIAFSGRISVGCSVCFLSFASVDLSAGFDNHTLQFWVWWIQIRAGLTQSGGAVQLQRQAEWGLQCLLRFEKMLLDILPASSQKEEM